MNAKLVGFFSGFPLRRFPDGIAQVLKEALSIRESLVFVSAWPEEHARNDEDADGMHAMFAEKGMAFRRHAVIDSRTDPEDARALVENASCIFLMGGNATLQMALIRRNGLAEPLRRTRAAVLGVSAGAMNMGDPTVDVYESLTPYEGLGFARLTVKAHYPWDGDIARAVALVSMEMPVCAMKDESAVFIRDGRVTALGEIYRIEKGRVLPFSFPADRGENTGKTGKDGRKSGGGEEYG